MVIYFNFKKAQASKKGRLATGLSLLSEPKTIKLYNPKDLRGQKADSREMFLEKVATDVMGCL